MNINSLIHHTTIIGKKFHSLSRNAGKMRADDGEIKKVKYVLVPYFFYKNLY